MNESGVGLLKDYSDILEDLEINNIEENDNEDERKEKSHLNKFDENNDIKDESKHLLNKINFLENENKILKNENEKYNNEIKNLKHINQKMVNDYELESLKADFEDENIDLIKDELNKSKNSHINLLKQNELEKTKLKNSYQDKIDTLLTQYNNLLYENNNMKNEFNSLDIKFKASLKTIEELKEKNIKIGDKVIDDNKNNENNEEMNNKIQEYENKIKNLKKQISEKDVLIFSLKNQNNKSLLSSLFGCFAQTQTDEFQKI
jgi:chromosome segregation ATPase